MFAFKFLNDSPLSVVIDKGIMFFRSAFRQRLEPVCNMGDSMLHSPLLHAKSNPVCCFSVECDTLVYTLQKGFESICVQILVHFRPVEYQFSEIIGGLFGRALYRHSLLFEGLFDQI
ncbi:unknown [Bacteroides sp. CAG:1060]|nr:unknown [Bacteroides sp. CAG:1060]